MRPAVSLNNELLNKTISAQKEITGTKAKIISLNLSAGHPSRYWSISKWEKLANKLLSLKKNIWLNILYSPKDIKLYKTLVSNLNTSRLLPKSDRDLNGFLTAIATSDLLVSPDTSAIHAACSLKIPIVGLYPETAWNFASWRPYGVDNIVIQSDNKDSIDNISYDKVEKAVLKMLSKSGK